MDDRTAPPAANSVSAGPASPRGGGLEDRSGLQRKYPTISYLRRAARGRLPSFAYEYMDGGAGDDKGILKNWAALDAVDIVPRYGVTTQLPPIDTELFGRRYAAPFGVAPMGGPAFVWPGADEYLARAAQAANIPYVLGTPGGMRLERAMEIAPDVTWFQLYRFARNDHAIGLDLVRRAKAAGVHVLMLTLDVPVRTVRPREMAAGIGTRLRPDAAMIASLMMRPGWLISVLQNGLPRFATFTEYAEGSDLGAVMRFVQREMGGAFTWDEIARYRDAWPGALVVKGVLHPDDADRAVARGADAVVVSNHGGRQIEPLPAAIDALPGIVARVGERVPVLMDSGIRSGADVVRALALGATAVLAGKAFLWGLGALGARGPARVIDILSEETQAALGQIGAMSPKAARDLVVRHPRALKW